MSGTYSRLYIDIETYSGASLPDVGVHKYAADPAFEVLLVAYAVDGAPVEVLDLASGEVLPPWLHDALTGENGGEAYTLFAHNAAFERVCLGRLTGRELSPARWVCTMGMCATAGLPLSLDEAGKALGLERQKMTEGKRLLRLFTMPHPESLTHAGGRVSPGSAPDDWALFREYCRRDVEVERDIDLRLDWALPGETEHRVYEADQLINDRGVRVDMRLARNAETMNAAASAALIREARELSGLPNPTSVPQLKAWIKARTGDDLPALRKSVVSDLIRTTDDPVITRVLEIRQMTGKTSNSKWSAMQEAAGADGRARGLLQYHGTRTGRWAGRRVQLQNLPQTHLDPAELDTARALASEGDLAHLSLLFGDVSDTLSQLIRTAFTAPDGGTLAVVDFSAIEARVLAWLAGETWVLDAFADGKDIYCATASQMFGVPVEKHGANAHLRQRGKVAVLALGYGGGADALDAMGGSRLGMTRDEEQETVNRWRSANPRIVAFWSALERAAKTAVLHRVPAAAGPLVFRMQDAFLTCRLPSGRLIAWPDAHMGRGRRSGSALLYRAVGGDDGKPGNKWVEKETYGGKLAENVTQAVARDCLADVLVRLERSGVRTVFHVHDEVVCEVDGGERGLRDFRAIQNEFSTPPAWAAGLPLSGAGFMSTYYKKD